MKRIISILTLTALTIVTLASCKTANSGSISIVSREEGSGTRGAFIELFEIQEKDSAGKKVDKTSVNAEITNSTSVMMTTIAGNKNAIGYISLGSLNDTVKAVEIDGVKPSVENLKNKTYKISRPFNIITKGTSSEISADFISFILSKQGQEVIEKEGYISQNKGADYKGTGKSGEIKIAGSSSVTPVMEVLKESYNKLNPDVSIKIQQNDSSTGITSTIEGICDIGMASRELSQTEIAKGVSPQTIAMDGIAVILNKANTLNTLTSKQVKAIFTGEQTSF
ncbi:MAG: substrate-binding domain-containing protein [Oscillospiraceae bacterium]